MRETAVSTKAPTLTSGEQPLPHNSEAEVAVLGAMLLDPANAVDKAVTRLNFGDAFYSPAHQTIFETIIALSNEKPRAQIDAVTLGDALSSKNKLEEVGGASYIMRLMNSVPTAANVEDYIDIVHQNAVLRRLIRTSADIMNRCYNPQEEVRSLLDEVESEVLEVTNLSSGADGVAIGDMIFDAVQYLDQLHKRDTAAMGLPTGYPDLDNLITGLGGGDMCVLAARPSIGKTALALNIASNVALNEDRPTPVGIFSLEMSSQLLVLRMICSQARVSLGDIKEGALSAARWQDIMEASQILKKAPVYIDDTGDIDIVELRAKARRMAREHNIGLVVVDYLQLIRVSGVGRNATRENEVSYMSGGLKSLAKELNVPVLVLAQLNRQAEQAGQQPKLAHLRESGAIEQDSDIVALLHRERDAEGVEGNPQEGRESELIISKHRNGPTGVVPLTFMPAYTRFESRSQIDDADVPER